MVCAVMGMNAGVALAAAPRLVPDGSFPASAPIGVAVDQANGDVFAAGNFNLSTGALGQIEEFDAAGAPLSPPSPFGKGNLYAGAAVNPTDGDVDVLANVLVEGEISETAIQTYDPSSGARLSSFPVPASTNRASGQTTVQIATDAAGDVYVPVVPDDEVLEYSPSGTLLQTLTGAGALSGPTGVAVAPSGNLWVVDANDNRIAELSPADALLQEIESEGVQSVALDAHGDVFAIVRNAADFCGSIAPPCDHLVEYGPTGAQIADVGAGEFEPHEEFGFPSMPAVNESIGRVYVTDSGRNVIWVFTLPAAPVVGNKLAAEVSSSEAKLGALIDPEGIDTTYRFEYLTEAAFQADKESFSGPEHPSSVPFPEGTVGEGLSSRTVWASASGLAPGTTYHYRVVASNELGTVTGSDRTFTTGTSGEAACPNEQFRGGFSGSLPDCRAYELVTPPNKLSAQPDAFVYENSHDSRNLAAHDGSRFAYTSFETLPGSDSGGLEYLATRGAGGWSSEDVDPRQSYTGNRCSRGPGDVADTEVLAYSPDLSQAVMSDGADEVYGETSGLQAGCDGELVEVVSGEPLGLKNLLLRNDEDGAYQLIDLTPPGVTPEPAHFTSATEDLSHICFHDSAPLTPDAPASIENEYEWSGGSVRLVTVGAPAECGGASSGTDEAAGYSYFLSNAVLAGNENANKETAKTGENNLYVSHDGATTFIATLEAEEAGAGVACVKQASCTRVSPNGLFFAFQSPKSLTGYDNIYAPTGYAVPEVFLYSAASNSLACVSCNPSGEAPTHGIAITGAFGEVIQPEGGARLEPPHELGGAPHYLTGSGQLFFDTVEELLPSDTNGQLNVYEYENGEPRLISSGTSAQESVFLDASESGDDVFFYTHQSLVPRATTEETSSIYDARVDGGFPEPVSPPPCTTADACRAPASPQPSNFGEPSSQTFSGAGNLAPPPPAVVKPKPKTTKCKKGDVKNNKGKCVRKKHKKSKKAKKASNKGRA